MEDCLFCKIVRGEIPSRTVYQDQHVTAFLDIHPVALGHLLVIPNVHMEKLHQLHDSQVAQSLMTALAELSNRLVTRGFCENYSIVQSNGRLAEQDIRHVHFHIIPRHENDGVEFKLDTHSEARLSTQLDDSFQKLTTNL